LSSQLEVEGNRKSDTRIPAVVKIVPAVIIDVKIIGVVPVWCPVFRPGIHEQERKAAVRKPRVPLIDNGARHPEPVLTSEIETEAGLRNVVTAIAPTLPPGAMIAVPVLSPILLKCAMPLPGALLLPSPLLLPSDGLLLSALRLLLGLPGTLSLALLQWLLPIQLDLLLLSTLSLLRLQRLLLSLLHPLRLLRRLRVLP
jgi:hypothetical protein